MRFFCTLCRRGERTAHTKLPPPVPPPFINRARPVSCLIPPPPPPSPRDTCFLDTRRQLFQTHGAFEIRLPEGICAINNHGYSGPGETTRVFGRPCRFSKKLITTLRFFKNKILTYSADRPGFGLPTSVCARHDECRTRRNPNESCCFTSSVPPLP